MEKIKWLCALTDGSSLLDSRGKMDSSYLFKYQKIILIQLTRPCSFTFKCL